MMECENNTYKKIYISTKEKGNHYFFTCDKCKNTYEMITGDGRYGNLGPFSCPDCKEEYYATIDDHDNPCLYVTKKGEQPASLLDSNGRKRSIKLKNDGRGWH